MKRLLVSMQQTPVENQNLTIQCMQHKDVQDQIAVLKTESSMIWQQLEMAS